MRAWMVTVRDYEYSWGGEGRQSERVERRHYVVSFTRTSAMRQAKMMAGYPPGEADGRAGIVSAVILETL